MKQYLLQFLGALLTLLLIVPMISIADVNVLCMGIPVVYWYVFGLWFLGIIAAAFIIHYKKQ